MEEGSDSPVVVSRSDATGVIRLNRPRALNAITAETARLAGEALEELEADADVQVIVVTGTGERAFSTGADLKEFAAGVLPYAPREEWGFAGLTEHVVTKPVIAAVNGAALGGGLEIALWADLVVAAEEATFGLPEVRVGVIAGAGGLVRLPAQVPERVALAMALTGRPIDAAEALARGLVNEVVPRAELMDATLALAAQIAGNAPLAVRASKQIIRRIADGSVTTETAAWELSNRVMMAIRATEDAAEGPRAFAEKRPPVWRAR